MEITEDVFKLLIFYQWRHHNKGYAKDAHGNFCEPHQGYAWTMRSIELPRISFSDHYMMPNRKDYRVWHVDGEDVCEVEPGALPTDAFYVRVNKPPVLTLPEFVAWMRIGPGAVQEDMLLDFIAGCKNPTPYIIEVGTPWSTANLLVDALYAKGLLVFERGTQTVRRVEP